MKLNRSILNRLKLAGRHINTMDDMINTAAKELVAGDISDGVVTIAPGTAFTKVFGAIITSADGKTRTVSAIEKSEENILLRSADAVATDYCTVLFR